LIALHAPQSIRELLDAVPGVVETLAGLESVGPIPVPRPASAIPLAFEGEELLLSGLVDAVDLEAEHNRLQKLIEDKRSAIAALTGRLSNESYVNKAPAQLVEQSRKQLETAQADLEAARLALDSLGGA
jgi:valyl-tRNA synthetase